MASGYTGLAKRARYYQGLMDVDSIQFGQEYSALKDSYVIFLCLGDAFGRRLPVYTFRYRAEEDKNILMDDGTVNIFFNAAMYDKMRSEGFVLKNCMTQKTSVFKECNSVHVVDTLIKAVFKENCQLK